MTQSNWHKYDAYPPTIRSLIQRYKYGNGTRQQIINQLKQYITIIENDERQEQWKLQQPSLPEHE